jgi:small conductance mechanosensitive channel
MLYRLSILVVALAVVLGPAGSFSLAQEPATQEASSATTQPAAATSNSDQTIVDSVNNTQLMRIMQGKTKLDWKLVTNPMFWIDSIKDLIQAVLLFVPRLIGTLLFLFVFWLIYRGIRRMAMGSMKKSDVDSSIREMLGTLIRWVVMGFGVVIACNQLGIPIVAMLTGVSIIGLAVGFAAQETLANFIAGIVIFLDKPFHIGDWINISDTFGQVKRVSFRSTRLLTLDGEIVVFPNTQMLNNKLTNHSTNPINRISVPVGIAYKESIDDARRILLGLTKDDTRLVQQPAPEVIVKECADSSVNLALRFWISDESIEQRIGYEYTEKAKKALDAAGIEIPFPHVQLFVENTPAVAALAGNGQARGGVN